MRRSHWRTVFATAAAVVVLSGGITSATVPNEIRDTIINRVATEQNVPPSQLEIGDLAKVEFPLTGVVLYNAKINDPESGRTFGMTVNAAGSEADLRSAKQAEARERLERYGNLSPELHKQIAGASPETVISVGIWLKSSGISGLERQDISNFPIAPEPPPTITGAGPGGSNVEDGAPSDEPTQAERHFKAQNAVEQAARAAINDSLRASNSAHLQAAAEEIQGPFVAELAALGFEPVYASISAPLVYFDLPASVVIDLSRRTDIEAIYPNYDYSDAMATAKPTHKADIVDGVFGFDGANIELAILEDSRIQFNNPYLITGTTRVPADPNVDQHATATAGMAASQHSTLQGIAQGVSLFSANGTTYNSADISAAMDWSAVTQNNDIINNSWGGNDSTTTLNVHDRHLDYIVRNHFSTVTVAAGNEGNGSGRVGSPARAFNVISVGNHQDLGTVGWADDIMSSSSSYLDPSTLVEKPEVSASGSSIESTTAADPWTGNVGSGTSYAAPMVAGEAALLMERNSSLEVYPEAVKAIIMATALHNIEGASRLSEYDGAGSVDMRAAFRVADEGWWEWDSVTAADFPYSFYHIAYPGETVRAVIAWDSNPDAGYTTDPLEADLDFYVYDSSGTQVASSTYIYNNFEIVEFVAPASDTYEFRITAYSFTGSTEYVGFAVWRGHDVMLPNVIYGRGTPPVSRDHFIADVGSFWNAIGIRSPAGANYNNYLYDGSAFGDPDNYVLLEDSTISTVAVDFVVIDSNHAPNKEYFLENRAVSGTGSYTTQFAPRTTDTGGGEGLDAGTHGPYSFNTVEILRVFDSSLSAGVRKYFAIKPTSGDADIDAFLYDSDPAVSATWYQGRSQAVAFANTVAPGGDEYFNYEAATSDYYGLVVVNSGSTTSTDYMVYTDTTAPTGGILMEGGASVTSSLLVNADLPASDAETGVPEMRWSFNNSTWSSWAAYQANVDFGFATGGLRTLWIQYRNNTNMESLVYSDSIFINMFGSDYIFYDGFESGGYGEWDGVTP